LQRNGRLIQRTDNRIANDLMAQEVSADEFTGNEPPDSCELRLDISLNSTTLNRKG
jgi:hypothetical protein